MYQAGGYDEQYEAEGDAILVPQASTKKIRDKSGKMPPREATVLKLRACMQCRLVLSEDQFMEHGCKNCPELQLDDNSDNIWQHTTPNFKGLTVILRPDVSWVAKFNGLTQVVPGAYAVSLMHSNTY
eukprot:Protomagalhaensia_wolfi_Nauph_80__2598@NODE_2743_length_999_cov_173_060417_g2148_i0_p1_GENE_NODE_2743_length_999_cov_173_060417_g2148_i0NODE_2743_length_999_cov_173_060417_g2148_i0_p1_ORF_typecomplete_len127_score20_06Spt4/PF06093_13/2_5e25TBCC/PF07986_12/0_1_NODE_2743_length_999_cov_173_060417_g2148_i051431